MELLLAKKKPKHLCRVKGCSNPSPAVKYKDTRRGHICSKCLNIRWRANNPEKSIYSHLKSAAKRRGHKFTLTYEQFKTFADEMQLVRLKKADIVTISIDRKDPLKGYEDGNLQLMTLEDNSRKQMVYDRLVRKGKISCTYDEWCHRNDRTAEAAPAETKWEGYG